MISQDEATDIGLRADDIANVRKPLEQACVLPPAAYTSSKVFELEKERIFGRTWMPVCHVSQLPEKGDYVTRKLVGESVLAMRGKDGEINVMSNVCRHRNTTIAQEHRGNCKGNRISCPYHGWTYGLDGKLLAAPFMDQVDDFDRKSVSLPVFRSEIWNGIVFVNFDNNAQALAPQLEGLQKEVEPYHYEDMEAVELLRTTVPWNWKISLENFSEAYHQPWVHPNTADHEFPAAMAEYQDVTGPYGLFYIFQKDKAPVHTPFPHIAGLPERHKMSSTVFNVYPYMHSLADPATPIWLDFNIPNQYEHEVVWSILLPKGAKDLPDHEQSMQAFKDFIRPILAEDVSICVGVGDGVESRFVTPGRLSHMEKTVHQFHNWWLDRMQNLDQ